jgi:hypothetical protein
MAADMTDITYSADRTTARGDACGRMIHAVLAGL